MTADQPYTVVHFDAHATMIFPFYRDAQRKADFYGGSVWEVTDYTGYRADVGYVVVLWTS